MDHRSTKPKVSCPKRLRHRHLLIITTAWGNQRVTRPHARPKRCLTQQVLVTSMRHWRSGFVLVVLRNFNLLRLVLDRTGRTVAALRDVPDGHADFAFVLLTSMRLPRLAPAAIEQRDGGGHARRVVGAVLGDASQNLYRDLGVGPRQGTDIGRCSGHLAKGLPPCRAARTEKRLAGIAHHNMTCAPSPPPHGGPSRRIAAIRPKSGGKPDMPRTSLNRRDRS